MPWSITLGRVGETAVRMHLTFLLLLAWIGISAAMYGGAAAALANVIFILLLFACVLLHEFGHILMARRFGISTPEVTLLPIGGVASLERMPENPREQLLVAIAGPLVNVAIALLLFVVLGAWMKPEEIAKGLVNIDNPGVGLLIRLAAANVFLVLFNLLPAYPMDGGRVLKALLSMKMDKRHATQIAGRIGQGMALLFGFLGLFGNPLLLFIAIFVYLGAAGEMAQGELEEVTSSLKVEDAMETNVAAVPVEATLAQAVDILLATPQVEFPVTDHFGKAAGLLTRDGLIAALQTQPRDGSVMDAVQAAAPSVRASDSLDNSVREMNRLGLQAMNVVDPEGRLVGLLTMQNIAEMMMIRSVQPEWNFGKSGRRPPRAV